MEEKSKKIEAFQTRCRKQGIPMTIQRRAILEALLDRKDHPTADQMFDAVQNRIPGVSRTTVYRVLETLVRVGAAQKVNHPGATVRFDPNTERHHHLVCIRCAKVIDLEAPTLNALRLPDTRRERFKIIDFSIQFTGVCLDCQSKAT